MNSNKYLFLKFVGAGYFRNTLISKDYVYDYTGKYKRSEFIRYVEPINVNHISNALHVLLGERPVPSLRASLTKKNNEIFNMANDGYLKINSVMYTKKNGDTQYPEEIIGLRKSAWNSFSKIPQIATWENVRRLLENDLNNQFHQMLNELFGEDVKKKYTCVLAVKKLRENFSNDMRLIEFIDVLKKNLKQPMIDFINGGQKPNSNDIEKDNKIGAAATFNSNIRTLITTSYGIDYITKLDGEIIIPINDVYYQKLKNNKGFARLLDGGLLWIDDIVDEDMIFDSTFIGFTKINTISTEAVKPTKTNKNENNS